jgi:hypothetical protein
MNTDANARMKTDASGRMNTDASAASLALLVTAATLQPVHSVKLRAVCGLRIGLKKALILSKSKGLS